MAVVDGHVGLAEHRATLAAAIDVTGNGRCTREEIVIAEHANHDMIFGIPVIGIRGRDDTLVIAHMAFPSTTIDITHGTALDIGIAAGNKVLGTHHILDGTTLTGGIYILRHRTTEYADIGRTRDDGLGTLTTTVSITGDSGALVDKDVGVVCIGLICPVIHVRLPDQRVRQSQFGQVILSVISVAIIIST